LRILVAEDDPFSRSLIEKTLRKWGYEVQVVSDGLQALEALQREDGPSLAIVDWLMPGLDGLELCRRVRQVDSKRPTYIIVLTARRGVDELVEAMEAGADDFVTKSFDVRELRVRVRAGERTVRLEESLRRLAARDVLTDLHNRRSILELLEVELARAKRQNAAVSVIMADIDHFKRVNDVYGHADGDVVLAEVARRLELGVRQYDAVGRYGGEEFLVVLPGASRRQTAEIAERLRAGVASPPVKLSRGKVVVTSSFGVAASGEGQNLDLDSLIRLADAALYRAKDAGRNRVAVSTAGDDKPVDLASQPVPAMG